MNCFNCKNIKSGELVKCSLKIEGIISEGFKVCHTCRIGNKIKIPIYLDGLCNFCQINAEEKLDEDINYGHCGFDDYHEFLFKRVSKWVSNSTDIKIITALLCIKHYKLNVNPLRKIIIFVAFDNFQNFEI